MKKTAMGLLGFAFALMATHASAVVVDFGLIPGAGTDGFEAVVETQVPEPGNFDDTFLFTLDQDASVLASVSSVPNRNGFVFLDIENLQATLLGPSGTVATFSGNVQTGSIDLGAGDYVWQITGTATGVVGGLYTTAITAVTDPSSVPDPSAVPIPAAGFLFFSGMAALGLVRSKRASA